MSPAICFNLDQTKILSSGYELIVAEMVGFVLEGLENTVVTGENAGFSHNVFNRFFVGIVW